MFLLDHSAKIHSSTFLGWTRTYAFKSKDAGLYLFPSSVIHKCATMWREAYVNLKIKQSDLQYLKLIEIYLKAIQNFLIRSVHFRESEILICLRIYSICTNTMAIHPFWFTFYFICLIRILISVLFNILCAILKVFLVKNIAIILINPLQNDF